MKIQSTKKRVVCIHVGKRPVTLVPGKPVEVDQSAWEGAVKQPQIQFLVDSGEIEVVSTKDAPATVDDANAKSTVPAQVTTQVTGGGNGGGNHSRNGNKGNK